MQARTGRVAVLGSVNVDLVVRGSRLPAPGETVVGGEFYQASGGKGANQAVAAARLAQQRVSFLAAVGDDAFGKEQIASLLNEGLDIAGLRVIAGAATGVALILVDAQGQNLISVASGANGLLIPRPEDVERWRKTLEQCQVALVSLETPLETVATFLRLARQAGCVTILNPAPVPPRGSRDCVALTELFPLIDWLTPNETEASQLAGLDVLDADSAVAAGRRMQGAGCGAVVVTRGAAGVTVVAQEAWSTPAPQVAAVDATAAGDAFNGALAVALAEGRQVEDAVTWAVRAASISVTRKGAQPSLPRRSELDDDLETM